MYKLQKKERRFFFLKFNGHEGFWLCNLKLFLRVHLPLFLLGFFVYCFFVAVGPVDSDSFVCLQVMGRCIILLLFASCCLCCLPPVLILHYHGWLFLFWIRSYDEYFHSYLFCVAFYICKSEWTGYFCELWERSSQTFSCPSALCPESRAPYATKWLSDTHLCLQNWRTVTNAEDALNSVRLYMHFSLS